MKKIVLLLILVVSLPMMAQAQCDKSKHDNNKNRTEWFAQMRAKKLLFLVDAMDLTETERAAFSVLFEKYLAHQKATKSASTITHATTTYNNYLTPFHNLPVSKINNKIINEWQIDLLSKGYKNSTLLLCKR